MPVAEDRAFAKSGIRIDVGAVREPPAFGRITMRPYN